MQSLDIQYDSIWAKTQNSVFELNDDYHSKSGGIFMSSGHYEEMFSKKK